VLHPVNISIKDLSPLLRVTMPIPVVGCPTNGMNNLGGGEKPSPLQG
jgi:hypothetical protein